jgi:Leucine-rich repeat (LRR) protein
LTNGKLNTLDIGNNGLEKLEALELLVELEELWVESNLI